jgi:hypothetical protein
MLDWRISIRAIEDGLLAADNYFIHSFESGQKHEEIKKNIIDSSIIELEKINAKLKEAQCLLDTNSSN